MADMEGYCLEETGLHCTDKFSTFVYCQIWDHTDEGVGVAAQELELSATDLQFLKSNFPMAFTLGHTVLGQTDAALDVFRKHEMVHVRQFERWGPFMGPAYLGCSLVLWLMNEGFPLPGQLFAAILGSAKWR
jgi:hypothetical protein